MDNLIPELAVTTSCPGMTQMPRMTFEKKKSLSYHKAKKILNSINAIMLACLCDLDPLKGSNHIFSKTGVHRSIHILSYFCTKI